MIGLRLRVFLGRAYMFLLTRAARLAGRVIPNKSIVGRALAGAQGALTPTPVSKLSVLLRAFAQARPHVRFVQIGANDGVLEDPLHEFIRRYRWQGILVEPMPALFERLKQNYAGCEGLVFENVAISRTEGVQEFYSLAADSAGSARLPWYHTGIGTLSKETLLSHAREYPGLEQHIVVNRVPGLPFEALCARHGVRELDLIAIDAEGYDFEILQMIDFTRHRPLVLIYEQFHMSEAQQAACAAMLGQLGYECLQEVLNTVCLDVRALTPRDARLRATWQELKRTPWIPI